MADSNVTITKSGVTFTFSDGDVERVNSDISAQLDIMPLPAGAPANTFLLDLGGATKTITVTGSLKVAATNRLSTGGPITSIADQKDWLEALINGAQSTVTFSSGYEEKTMGSGDVVPNQTALVMVSRMTFAENAGDPNQLPYTIILKAGV
jgi:hypothetical protein